MRWWRRRGRRGRSWKRGLPFWRVGTARRGGGWRSWRGPFKESKGLGDCWRRGDDNISNTKREEYQDCNKGRDFVRKGIRKCVKLGIRIRYRKLARGPLDRDFSSPSDSSKSASQNCYYKRMRIRQYSDPASPQPPDPLTSILALSITPSDFELFLTELWRDFLIEPTPYLVASALCYLGLILLLGRYYELVWRFCLFLAWVFVPLDDDEWIFGYS